MSVSGGSSLQPRYAGYQVLTGTRVMPFSENDKYPFIIAKTTSIRISGMQLGISDSTTRIHLAAVSRITRISVIRYHVNAADIQDAHAKKMALCAEVPPYLPALDINQIALVFSIHCRGIRVKPVNPACFLTRRIPRDYISGRRAHFIGYFLKMMRIHEVRDPANTGYPS